MNSIDENKVSKLGASLAGGFIVTVMIYAIGHISGAHMNPAVSLAFATVKHFPWKQVCLFILKNSNFYSFGLNYTPLNQEHLDEMTMVSSNLIKVLDSNPVLKK